jgi:L,D-transpeptidase catalytic domain
MSQHRDWKAVFLSLLFCVVSSSVWGGEVSLLIDTGAGTMTVLDGAEVIHTFGNISIGRYGVTKNKRRGDNKTPLGHFRIGWITRKTRYHRFLGLTYPDLEIASIAFGNGMINKKEWLAIRHAVKHRKIPPQNTPLGGQIGIHGVGKGDLEMHRHYNWTNGCVALSNEEIDQLLGWVGVGTPVEIR